MDKEGVCYAVGRLERKGMRGYMLFRNECRLSGNDSGCTAKLPVSAGNKHRGMVARIFLPVSFSSVIQCLMLDPVAVFKAVKIVPAFLFVGSIPVRFFALEVGVVKVSVKRKPVFDWHGAKQPAGFI